MGIGFSEAFDGFREVMNARTPANSDDAAHPADERPLNALSFDIEDWFHLVEIDAVANVDDWPGFPSIVERRTDEILGI